MGTGGLIKKKREFPSTTVILFLLLIVVTIMTYIVPAGEFCMRVDAVSGLEMVDAEQFRLVTQSPVSPFRFFVNITQGFIDGAPIIFLIIFGYFWVFSVVGSGAFGAGINRLLNSKARDSKLLIPLVMFIFALAGSTYGEMETIYGLLPIFVALAIALGYDAIVGICMSAMAVAVGFASATTNPFTIGIAQSIAGLPIFSGLVYRWLIFVVFTGVSIIFTMRYAERIKKDPSKSYVYGEDYSGFSFVGDTVSEEFTTRHKILLLSMIVTVGVIIVGSLVLGWYINEMSGIFLLSGLMIQVFNRKRPNEIGLSLTAACAEMATAVVVVGLSRAVLVILREGHIIDSVVYGLYLPMRNAPAWMVGEMMLIAQNIINFFIPSGSGQATAIMPIMTPLADLAGLNRQIAVLAFQFGDGYSNMLWPNGVCAIVCGIAKVPINKWYRFFLKLFAVMLVLQFMFIAIAVAINYGPL